MQHESVFIPGGNTGFHEFHFSWRQHFQRSILSYRAKTTPSSLPWSQVHACDYDLSWVVNRVSRGSFWEVSARETVMNAFCPLLLGLFLPRVAWNMDAAIVGKEDEERSLLKAGMCAGGTQVPPRIQRIGVPDCNLWLLINGEKLNCHLTFKLLLVRHFLTFWWPESTAGFCWSQKNCKVHFILDSENYLLPTPPFPFPPSLPSLLPSLSFFPSFLPPFFISPKIHTHSPGVTYFLSIQYLDLPAWLPTKENCLHNCYFSIISVQKIKSTFNGREWFSH